MAREASASDPFPFETDPWWRKTAILCAVLLPLAALAGLVAAGWRHLVGPPGLIAFAAMLAVTQLGVTLGYHRMLAHRAFQARAPLRAVLLVMAAMALQGPPADWAATHIRHHARADRRGDPHSPVRGFWHAHVAWMLRDRFVRRGPAHARLMRDPVVRFVQRTWMPWAVLGFVIPGIAVAAVHGAAGAFWTGVLWGGVIRVFVAHHLTWSVNSVTHMFGTRPFPTPDRSRNNIVVALLSWGEGWHNNHHAFPNSAFTGLRWWQPDLGGWVLALLRLTGLVKTWHRPDRHAVRQRMRWPTDT